MNASSILSAGPFGGRYAVEREIGHGATAIVYLARDISHGRPVAIKVLRRELAESLSADRFLKEIRTMAQLQHPNIVPVLDSGEHEGRLYCVMPYMEGGTFRGPLQRKKQLPLGDVVDVGISIARALAYAHERNVVHRDVKPENILFAGGQACLADFGIARAIERAAEETTTSTGIVVGTPAYMSPEQASGETDYDGRSDVYSLGCVLYEAIAGIPAFVGPTPQSVVAQRLAHDPRPVHVYRPRVPEALEGVLERALAMSPADRFQSAAELAEALEGVRAAVVATSTGPASFPTRRVPHRLTARGIAFGLVTATTVVALVYGGQELTRTWLLHRAALDSTRIVVFPFDAGGRQSNAGAPHDMLQAGLRAWNGATIVSSDDVAEASKRRGVSGAPTLKQARVVAASLGAERFITGRLSRTPTGTASVAEYRHVRLGVLHTARIDIPRDSNLIEASYQALADSLLLRGGSHELPLPVGRPRSLPATQAFLRGLHARDQWHLAAADSAFVRALEFAPAASRASLWLAQVRSWQSLPTDQWVTSAERAIADSGSLTPDEQWMARGLVALAAEDYPTACAAYRILISRDSRSFAGWYGLGECHRRDIVVLPDARSPSGWRFRSSYEQAIRAYARAFEIHPATYRGFHVGGYDRLRRLLLTDGQLRSGRTQSNPPAWFFAFTALSGDSIVMIPYPQQAIMGGGHVASASAVNRLRDTFHSIAARWAATFPQSAGAQEALGVSLELRGDRGAVRAMRAAESLAEHPRERFRLQATRLLLQTKYALAEREGDLQAIQTEAHTLLRSNRSPSPQDAGLLASIAVLLGQCRTASTLLERWASQTSPGVGSDTEMARVHALHAHAILGCGDPVPPTDEVRSRLGIPATVSGNQTDYSVIGPLLRASRRPDSAWVARLAPRGDYILEAWDAEWRGGRERARATIDRASRARREMHPSTFTPDGAVAEALFWLAIRDTAAAISVLDEYLDGLHIALPIGSISHGHRVVRTAALLRVAGLRADLAARTGDAATARRWSAALAVLWRNADPELQQGVQRLAETSS